MKKLFVTLTILAMASFVSAADVVISWEHDGEKMTPEYCGGTGCGYYFECYLSSDLNTVLARHRTLDPTARQMVFEDSANFAPGVSYTFLGYAVNSVGQSLPSAPFEWIAPGSPYAWPAEVDATTVYAAPSTIINVNVTCPSCP